MSSRNTPYTTHSPRPQANSNSVLREMSSVSTVVHAFLSCGKRSLQLHSRRSFNVRFRAPFETDAWPADVLLTQSGRHPRNNVDLWCCPAVRKSTRWYLARPGLAFIARSAKLFVVEDMHQGEPNSPRISHLSWGHIEVEGHPPFKDAKIFSGGAREWDWRETGTRHVPGIQPADVQELIEHGARTVVLSKGSGGDCRSVPIPWMFWPRTASKWRSCRPRPRSIASTNFVKISRSAGCSIPPAD